MGKTRTVIGPGNRTLHIKQNIIVSYKHRHLRQVVDVAFLKILLFLRTSVTEDTNLTRVQTRSLQLTETHSADTGLAHANLHPMPVRQD